MILEDFWSDEACCPYQSPGPLRGDKLTDPIVGELDFDCVLAHV